MVANYASLSQVSFYQGLQAAAAGQLSGIATRAKSQIATFLQQLDNLRQILIGDGPDSDPVDLGYLVQEVLNDTGYLDALQGSTPGCLPHR